MDHPKKFRETVREKGAKPLFLPKVQVGNVLSMIAPAHMMAGAAGQPEDSNWWEAYSIGIIDALKSRDPAVKGFYDRLNADVPYVELESDFLRLDDQGIRRQQEGDPTGTPIVVTTDMQLKTLALRVALFINARTEYKKRNYSLPDNPDLELAMDVVNAAFAKNAVAARQFEQILGGHIPTLPRDDDEVPQRRLP